MYEEQVLRQQDASLLPDVHESFTATTGTASTPQTSDGENEKPADKLKSCLSYGIQVNISKPEHSDKFVFESSFVSPVEKMT